MTLTELQAKREEILKSIGILRMTHGSDSVEFAEQEKSLALIDREINSASATSRVRQIRFYTDKGF